MPNPRRIHRSIPRPKPQSGNPSQEDSLEQEDVSVRTPKDFRPRKNFRPNPQSGDPSQKESLEGEDVSIISSRDAEPRPKAGLRPKPRPQSGNQLLPELPRRKSSSKRPAEDDIKEEASPRKRPRRKQHQMIDILSGTTADPLPSPPADSGNNSHKNPNLPKMPREKSFKKRPIEDAMEEGASPRKRVRREQHEKIDTLSRTTSDPFLSHTTEALEKSHRNGSELMATGSRKPNQSDRTLSEPSLRSRESLHRITHAETHTVEAERESQADKLTDSLTTGRDSTSTQSGLPTAAYEQNIQPASRGNQDSEPEVELAPQDRVEQLKAGAKKKRPRRSAFGLRSGRKEVSQGE